MPSPKEELRNLVDQPICGPAQLHRRVSRPYYIGEMIPTADFLSENPSRLNPQPFPRQVQMPPMRIIQAQSVKIKSPVFLIPTQ